MFIRTPQGRQIPFSQVAEIVYARGYSIIKHKDRNRIINVFADIDSKKGNSGQLVSELGQDFVPMLKKDHPDVSISFGGQAEQRAKSLGSYMRASSLPCWLYTPSYQLYLEATCSP